MYTQMLVSCHMNFTVPSRMEPRGEINPDFPIRNKPVLNVFYRDLNVTTDGEIRGENL